MTRIKSEKEEWMELDSARTIRLKALEGQPVDRDALRDARAAGFSFRDAMAYAKLCAADKS